MSYKLHAINFPKEKFTYNQARSRFVSFGQKLDHYTNYPNFWRFTTVYTKEWLKKNKYNKYRTKELPDGTQLVLTYK